MRQENYIAVTLTTAKWQREQGQLTAKGLLYIYFLLQWQHTPALVSSREFIAAECGLNYRVFRQALKMLTEENLIVCKGRGANTVFYQVPNDMIMSLQIDTIMSLENS